MKARSIALAAVAVNGVVLAAFMLTNKPELAPATIPEKALDNAAQAAEVGLRSEPKVKDVLFQPGQAVEWQIGVLDDGTSRVGYANYVCDLLAEKHALMPQTDVRIVDIVKVTNGVSFRNASLGHVICATREIVVP